MNYTYRYRSFFWPGILILAGIIALLVNTGRISTDRLAQLFDLWPLILIVIGLELIIRRTAPGRAADGAGAVIALVAIVGAVVYVVASPNPENTSTLDVSQAVGTIDHAALEVDVGAATITMTSSPSSSSDLFHAHVEYSGPKPDVTLDRETGQVRVSQSNSGFNLFRSRRFVMNLELNPSVPWTISVNTGAATETLNLAAVHVSSIDINTGASHEEITVGPPSGIVPITVNGGALTVQVHRSSGTAASVSVSGGAISLNADGRQTRAIGNLSFETAGFGQATDGYRVQVDGGACTVSIDTSAGSS
jgi:hypothetical protein